MEEHEIDETDACKASRRALIAQLSTLRDTMGAADSAHEERLAKWTERIAAEGEALRKRAGSTRVSLEDPVVFDGGPKNLDAALEHLGAVRPAVETLVDEARQLEEWQTSLRVPVSQIDDVRALSTSLRLSTEMWDCMQNSADAVDEWEGLAVAELEPHDVEATITRYAKAIGQAERGLPPNTVVPALKGNKEMLTQLLPIVVALRNPALNASHYARIDAAIGVELPRGAELTAGFVIRTGLLERHAVIARISSEATQESPRGPLAPASHPKPNPSPRRRRRRQPPPPCLKSHPPPTPRRRRCFSRCSRR